MLAFKVEYERMSLDVDVDVDVDGDGAEAGLEANNGIGSGGERKKQSLAVGCDAVGCW